MYELQGVTLSMRADISQDVMISREGLHSLNLLVFSRGGWAPYLECFGQFDLMIMMIDDVDVDDVVYATHVFAFESPRSHVAR
jgi:hypothetical protein